MLVQGGSQEMTSWFRTRTWAVIYVKTINSFGITALGITHLTYYYRCRKIFAGLYNQFYNVPPCLSGEEGCFICPTILEEAADRGARIDDRVFLLVSDFECNCVRFYLQGVQIFSVFYILTV
jgi:hypothetical protein